MKILYQVFIQLFFLSYRFVGLFSDKAKKGFEGRENQKEYFKSLQNQMYVWVHCSSVGEFEQGRPLIEAIKKECPHKKIALSFFSPSGYELRKDYPEVDAVFYMPIDTKENWQTFFKYFNPAILILVKYDYWFNLLNVLYHKNIPVVVVSAIFRENQYHFKNLENKIFKALNKYISHFFVQNEASAKVLKKHEISQFSITGDTRYDRVSQIAQQDIQLPWLEDFKEHKNLLVLGSTWPTDEKIILNVLKKELPKDWKVVIVPHEINQNTIPHFKKEFGANLSFYTEGINNKEKFLVVDAIGFLSKIYAYADVAYVGGGFNKSGVHNTLEPAVFGIPIIIGPHHKKFQEVQDLMQAGVLFSVSNQETFKDTLNQIIKQDPEQFKRKRLNVFEKNVGATQKILTFLKNKHWL